MNCIICDNPLDADDIVIDHTLTYGGVHAEECAPQLMSVMRVGMMRHAKVKTLTTPVASSITPFPLRYFPRR